MGIKKTLGMIVLAGAIGLSGCDDKPQQEYISGTVLKEAGTIIDRQKIIENSKDSSFGNTSINFGKPTYVIQFKVDDGKVYTFAVKESDQNKLDALNLAIEEGTRIRINKWNFYYYLKGTVGQINDYELEVPEQE